MKCLSLTQPYAQAIFIDRYQAALPESKLKTHETRSWTPKATLVRNDFAIHASAADSPKLRKFWAETIGLHAPKTILYSFVQAGFNRWEDFPFGAVIGIVRLQRVTETRELVKNRSIDWSDKILGVWDDGRFAWELSVVEQFAKPIPAKGQLGLWEWNEKA